MTTVTLGSTGITVNRNGFGALPVQRVSVEEAGRLLRKAFENGIRFFDTARSYSDSEMKIGLALSDVREHLYIATKTPSTTVEGFWKDLETSLSWLKTDYIDVYQFHNPAFCPKPGDGTGLYEAMLEAKAQGKIRHIGITNHRLAVAEEAVDSGLYETLQFPFSYLASETFIEAERVSLAGDFCRGCGYCMPCPAGIEINQCARMSLLLRRSPAANWLTPAWQEKMEKIEDCLHCGQCMKRCPYGLQTPDLLRRNLEDYRTFLH